MCLVKICAITSPEDAHVAVEAGADLIGLIFAEKSKRKVTLEQARLIQQSLNIPSGRPHLPSNPTADPRQYAQQLLEHTSKPLLVGVFQNQSIEFMNQVASEVNLDLIQLHGQEPHDIPSQLCRPVIRAIGVPAGSEAKSLYETEILPHLNRSHLFLLDTKSNAGCGGLGEVFDWQIAKELNERFELPFILAGGLHAENVQEAIRLVSPLGVDVASGVELKDRPGKKDHEKVKAFISSAANGQNKFK